MRLRVWGTRSLGRAYACRLRNLRSTIVRRQERLQLDWLAGKWRWDTYLAQALRRFLHLIVFAKGKPNETLTDVGMLLGVESGSR